MPNTGLVELWKMRQSRSWERGASGIRQAPGRSNFGVPCYVYPPSPTRPAPGKRPHPRQHGATSSSFALQQVADMGSFAFHGGLEWLGPLVAPPREWVLQHEPRELQPDIAKAVQEATATVGGRVLRAQLPLFREDARTLAKPRAGSTLRERLRQFLESAEGRDWVKSRAALAGGRHEAPGESDADSTGSGFDAD